MKPRKKPKKIDVDSEQFAIEAANLALSQVEIKQCRDCTHPVISGYCCGFCGSTSPTSWNDDSIGVQF